MILWEMWCKGFTGGLKWLCLLQSLGDVLGATSDLNSKINMIWRYNWCHQKGVVINQLSWLNRQHNNQTHSYFLVFLSTIYHSSSSSSFCLMMTRLITSCILNLFLTPTSFFNKSKSIFPLAALDATGELNRTVCVVKKNDLILGSGRGIYSLGKLKNAVDLLRTRTNQNECVLSNKCKKLS